MKSRTAVAPILASLAARRTREDEVFRAAAVGALGRIGDCDAIRQSCREMQAVYSTVAVYSYRNVCDAALRAITGEQHVVGPAEWLAWWAKNQGGK